MWGKLGDESGWRQRVSRRPPLRMHEAARRVFSTHSLYRRSTPFLLARAAVVWLALAAAVVRDVRRPVYNEPIDEAETDPSLRIELR
jgi:hypothetical protein